MASIQQIASYAQSRGRNKIVLSTTEIPGLGYVDLGQTMSKILGDDPDNLHGKWTVYRRAMRFATHDYALGRYLAIKNIGILFEPDLHHNLEAIIDHYSSCELLIITAPGTIENDEFLFMGDKDFKINLRGLSYIMVN